MRAEQLTRDESKRLISLPLPKPALKIFLPPSPLQPQLVIIDSIQNPALMQMLESAAGSIGQVRQCTAELMKFAKEANTPFLVGHITKDGIGPVQSFLWWTR